MFRTVLFAAFVIFTAQGAAASSCKLAPNYQATANRIFEGVNANRMANGLKPLVYNERLAAAASIQACDMATHGIVGHQGSDGSRVGNRANAAGYKYCTVAENLAWGAKYTTADRVVSGWMHSHGHKENILNAKVIEMGISVTQGPGGPYTALVLGRRC